MFSRMHRVRAPTATIGHVVSPPDRSAVMLPETRRRETYAWTLGGLLLLLSTVLSGARIHRERFLIPGGDVLNHASEVHFDADRFGTSIVGVRAAYHAVARHPGPFYNWIVSSGELLNRLGLSASTDGAIFLLLVVTWSLLWLGGSFTLAKGFGSAYGAALVGVVAAAGYVAPRVAGVPVYSGNDLLVVPAALLLLTAVASWDRGWKPSLVPMTLGSGVLAHVHALTLLPGLAGLLLATVLLFRHRRSLSRRLRAITSTVLIGLTAPLIAGFAVFPGHLSGYVDLYLGGPRLASQGAATEATALSVLRTCLSITRWNWGADNEPQRPGNLAFGVFLSVLALSLLVTIVRTRGVLRLAIALMIPLFPVYIAKVRPDLPAQVRYLELFSALVLFCVSFTVGETLDWLITRTTRQQAHVHRNAPALLLGLSLPLITVNLWPLLPGGEGVYYGLRPDKVSPLPQELVDTDIVFLVPPSLRPQGARLALASIRSGHRSCLHGAPEPGTDHGAISEVRDFVMPCPNHGLLLRLDHATPPGTGTPAADVYEIADLDGAPSYVKVTELGQVYCRGSTPCGDARLPEETFELREP